MSKLGAPQVEIIGLPQPQSTDMLVIMMPPQGSQQSIIGAQAQLPPIPRVAERIGYRRCRMARSR
jgi:hypothetical protein